MSQQMSHPDLFALDSHNKYLFDIAATTKMSIYKLTNFIIAPQ